MTEISITLFGPARVTIGPDDQPIRLGKSAMALLVFLSLNHGRPVARETVGAELWPDATPDRVRSRLSTAVWRLRGAFRDKVPYEVVEDLDGGSIMLAQAVGQSVDVVRFEETARAYLDDPATAPCPCEAGLLRDEPLAGWYDVWALSARVRLQDLRESCLTQLLDQQAAAGEDVAATETAEVLLTADPLREDVYRVLMRLAAQQGRPGLIARQFERCRAVLAEELGIEPSIETRSLLQDLQQQERPVERPRAGGSDRAALADLRRTLRETQASLARMSSQLDTLLPR